MFRYAKKASKRGGRAGVRDEALADLRILAEALEDAHRLRAERGDPVFPGIRFVAILGNRPGAPLKPDPEIVQEVLRKANVQPADALLVGDSPTDMKTAANGGIESIAVTWGYRTAEELAGHHQVHNVEELRNQLLK